MVTLNHKFWATSQSKRIPCLFPLKLVKKVIDYNIFPIIINDHYIFFGKKSISFVRFHPIAEYVKDYQLS